jgi:hypothetical protein
MALSTDDDGRAVLGREVERLSRRSKAIDKRVEELAELLATLGGDVKALLTRTNRSTPSGCGRGCSPPTPSPPGRT